MGNLPITSKTGKNLKTTPVNGKVKGDLGKSDTVMVLHVLQHSTELTLKGLSVMFASEHNTL